MTTLTHNYQAQGSADADDKRAMLMVVASENVTRTAYNSTTPPPVSLKAILPTGTAAEIKSSYEAVMMQRIGEIHAKYIKQAAEQADSDTTFKDLRPLWIDANQAKKAAALAALK
jgi:hypothetical protein